jgi:hypothetical protein
MIVADEDLRHGLAAGLFTALGGQGRIPADVDLLVVYPLAAQKLLGLDAVGTYGAGIDYNFGHFLTSSGKFFTGYSTGVTIEIPKYHTNLNKRVHGLN